MPLCNHRVWLGALRSVFQRPPPRHLLEVRIGRKTGGVQPGPRPQDSSKPQIASATEEAILGENQLFLHVDTSLAQQLGNGIAAQS